MTIDESIGTSGISDLALSAASVAGYLRGDGFLYQPQHVDAMRDFLKAAYQELLRYCDNPKGSLPKDVKIFTMLLNAYLDSKGAKVVGEWFSQMDKLSTDLDSLKAGDELSEEKKKELISLCDAVNRYTSSTAQSRPSA